jgi:hypothetical protein
MPFPSKSAAHTDASNQDACLTPGWFAALLLALVLVAYPQVVLGLQTFIYRDFGIFSYPLAYHLRECFWRGEIPLWNPLNNCGIPFLAQWNTQVLYPPALFYLLLPLSWSLGVFCLLHLFFGGLGMYVLAQRWTQDRFAAAFAGLVFAFNGLMLNSLIWPATIAALGWMPWVVWLTERAWREGGRVVVVAALAGALQMLSGGTEVVLLTWVLLGVLCAAEFVRGEFPGGKVLLRAGVVVLLIAGLSAAQLLPFFELLDYSRRQQSISAAMWPMPATGLANFLVPLFDCRSYQGLFMQSGQSWTNSYYSGVTTVVLALGALWRARRYRRVWLLAGLTLLALVLALGEGTPVYGWVQRHVSAIGLMRFPVKFVILPVFALPLLATFALSERTYSAGGKSGRMILGWLGMAAVVLIFALTWSQWRTALPDDRPAMLFNGLARASCFLAIAAIWLCGNRSWALKYRRWWHVSLLLLVWLDLFGQMPQPPTVSRAVYQPGLSRRQSAPQWGVARAQAPTSLDLFYHLSLADLTADYLGRRFVLNADCNLLDDIPKCDGFFPLYPSDYAALFFNFYRDNEPAEPLKDFLGVSQSLVLESNRYDWAPRATAMPLLTAGQKPLFADGLAELQMLTNADFQPRRDVYLPAVAKPFIAISNTVAVELSPVSYSDQKIETRISSTAPAMVVVAQTYYACWRAYVDGRPVPLWPANYAFQALEVPAGSHEVKLVYDDQRFYAGATISLAVLVGCLGYCAFRRRPHGIPPFGGSDGGTT